MPGEDEPVIGDLGAEHVHQVRGALRDHPGRRLPPDPEPLDRDRLQGEQEPQGGDQLGQRRRGAQATKYEHVEEHSDDCADDQRDDECRPGGPGRTGVDEWDTGQRDEQLAKRLECVELVCAQHRDRADGEVRRRLRPVVEHQAEREPPDQRAGAHAEQDEQ